MSKRYINLKIGDYEAKIKDYQYKSRWPIGINVSGTRLGEATNPFGEPCYFYKSANAMTMTDGIAIARAIIKEAQG